MYVCMYVCMYQYVVHVLIMHYARACAYHNSPFHVRP